MKTIEKHAEKRVLVVEASRALSTAYCNCLKKAGYTPVLVESGDAALGRVAGGDDDFSVILLDLDLPDMDGLGMMKRLSARFSGTRTKPAIVVMATRGPDCDAAQPHSALAAMSHGAVDVILKPFDEETLSRTMRRALSHAVRGMGGHADIAQDGCAGNIAGAAAARDVQKRAQKQGQKHGLPHVAEMVGDSPAMQALYRTVTQVARSNATVFITGESGTGKELCAHAIHQQSARRDHPFITVHCASIPHDRLKSEVFGHVAGALPGATGAYEGAAAQAEGGTLFLDEITEMDTAMQSKLLRFVQTHSYKAVGGTQTCHADIRIICTTNRDPLEEMRAGRLREDLFYRLYVVPIHVPPLRAREGDVCDIARAILHDYAAEEGKSFDGFAPDVMQAFMQYGWPGNIRQLQNLLRNVVVLNDGGMITRAMLPENFLSQLGDPAPEPGPEPGPGSEPGPAARPEQIVPLWLSEKATIEEAIRLCGGNIPQAARHLEVSPSTIYRKRQSWLAASRKDAAGS